MSENYVTLVPEDPRFTPEAAKQVRARDRFAEIAPKANEIEIKVSETIRFFDCGENLNAFFVLRVAWRSRASGGMSAWMMTIPKAKDSSWPLTLRLAAAANAHCMNSFANGLKASDVLHLRLETLTSASFRKDTSKSLKKSLAPSYE
jgi:hypothetical protein